MKTLALLAIVFLFGCGPSVLQLQLDRLEHRAIIQERDIQHLDDQLIKLHEHCGR